MTSLFGFATGNRVWKSAFMKRGAAIIILVLMAFSCIHVHSRPGSQPIQNGAGSFIFADVQGNPDKPMTVWYYQPTGFSSVSPLVFVMHGAKRDAQRYRDEWAAYAEHEGFLLIVPEFSHKYYPGKREYNEGNLFDKMENPIPENDRAFTVIERLFDFVKEATQSRIPSYDIYGHSAGGQFVQRMVLFKTDARIRTAIAANPGLYAMASYSEIYPYGIRNSGVTPEDLRTAFNRKFILLLGEKDVMAEDLNLARSPDALAQGSSSFERGINFYASAKNQASRLGMTFNWKLTTVPGAAHHDVQLAQAAARLLFLEGND
jgi:pimeloyl-ACP methyl ester carboxylesterase